MFMVFESSLNGKNKSGLKIFFWLGHELGPSPGPAGPEKKLGTLNWPSLGHGSCLAGWVRVWKNPARTRPVAIPTCSSMTPIPQSQVVQPGFPFPFPPLKKERKIILYMFIRHFSFRFDHFLLLFLG